MPNQISLSYTNDTQHFVMVHIYEWDYVGF